MFLTTRGRYAVMAVLDMYYNFDGKTPISIKSMAERQGLSVFYLEQLFCSLKTAGIVKSIKGPGGGYTFEKPPEQILLSHILKAVGENIKIAKCQIENTESCSKKNNLECNSHLLWLNLEDYLNNYFFNTSIADIANKNFFFKKS